MHAKRPISVVILYAHPLLGEGLGRMLSAEPDLDVSTVMAGAGAPAEVMARTPDVVVVERGVRPTASALLDLIPGTLFIEFGMDTGLMYSYQRDEIPARPGGILRAIRHARRFGGASVAGLLSMLLVAGAIASAAGA